MTAASDEYTIIVMNADGPSKQGLIRKKGIEETLKSQQPLIVFVQEFRWKSGLHSREWKDNSIPDHYKYVGHEEAGFIFDTRELTFSRIDYQASVRQLYEEMSGTNNWSAFFELFRLSVHKIESKGIPHFQFLCVSWHGPYKPPDDKKRDTLDSLLTFLLRLKVEEDNLPIILGGDFNFKASEVKTCKPDSFVLYTPHESSIDMIITTSDFDSIFKLSDVEQLKENEGFDHTHLKVITTSKHTCDCETNPSSLHQNSNPHRYPSYHPYL